MIPHNANILLCDDDKMILEAASLLLNGLGTLTCCMSAEDALDKMHATAFDVLILDIQLGKKTLGIELISSFLKIDPDVKIIIFSGDVRFDWARLAMREGAFDYLPKDLGATELVPTVEKALLQRRLRNRGSQFEFEASRFENSNEMVGNSDPIKKMRNTLSKFRNSGGNVLITGETGTGKELAARALRGPAQSIESLSPFVAVDSATIQSSMAESLLFGHEKGAFTGAAGQVKGLFEQANNGIIYFDEISNMPLEIQLKLLRVIQEKEVRRLGSNRTIKVNFRVVCATNQSLETLVEQGHFKADLLQRLNVLPLFTPPLRERVEDILPLLDHFQSKIDPTRTPLTLSEDTKQVLLSYSWPGNVRELGNLVTFLFATCPPGDEITLIDLPTKFFAEADQNRERSETEATHFAGASASQMTGTNKVIEFDETTEHISFYEKVRIFERKIIIDGLQKNAFNASKSAKFLGIDRSYFYKRLKELAIDLDALSDSRPTR